MSGHIKFRGGPSRFSNINLIQWYQNKSHVVGHFYPNVSDDKPIILGGTLDLKQETLRWFTSDSQRPEDGTPAPPKCALESLAKTLNVNCEMAIVILNIILICFLFLGVLAVVFVMKRRYDKKVKYTEKYMRHFGIDLRLNPSQITDLDKWEIPRNSVVINRKLGEGAFGTVYGGETNFPGKGWVAVAVKTLKIGSSTEEKLDFLSEAEVNQLVNLNSAVDFFVVVVVGDEAFRAQEHHQASRRLHERRAHLHYNGVYVVWRP